MVNNLGVLTVIGLYALRDYAVFLIMGSIGIIFALSFIITRYQLRD